MPIYEFYCEKCDLKFEELMSFNDLQDIKCEECNGEAKKVMSRFSGVVKGSEHRPIDCIVGEDSEKRWNKVVERKKKRIKTKE